MAGAAIGADIAWPVSYSRHESTRSFRGVLGYPHGTGLVVQRLVDREGGLVRCGLDHLTTFKMLRLGGVGGATRV